MISNVVIFFSSYLGILLRTGAILLLNYGNIRTDFLFNFSCFLLKKIKNVEMFTNIISKSLKSVLQLMNSFNEKNSFRKRLSCEVENMKVIMRTFILTQNEES